MDTEVQETNGKGNGPGRKSKRARPVETVPARVIERQGKVALVEWMDGDQYRRATVPAGKLAGSDCPADILNAGMPWGEDWEAHFSEWPAPEVLANELRRQGIWTKEDFAHGLANVRAIINRIFVNPMVDEMRRTIGV